MRKNQTSKKFFGGMANPQLKTSAIASQFQQS
jgi:hypothetical protein